MLRALREIVPWIQSLMLVIPALRTLMQEVELETSLNPRQLVLGQP